MRRFCLPRVRGVHYTAPQPTNTKNRAGLVPVGLGINHVTYVLQCAEKKIKEVSDRFAMHQDELPCVVALCDEANEPTNTKNRAGLGTSRPGSDKTLGFHWDGSL